MKIAVVGAGVTGLVTAYILAKKLPDLEIDIYDKGPDPRLKERDGQYPSWGVGSAKSVRHITGSECVSLEADQVLSPQHPGIDVDAHQKGMREANITHSTINHHGLASWLSLIEEDKHIASFVEGKGMVPIYSLDKKSLEESAKWESELYAGEPHDLAKPRISTNQACSRVFSREVLRSRNVEVSGIWIDLKGMLGFILNWLDSRPGVKLKFDSAYQYGDIKFDKYDFIIDATSSGEEFIKLNGLWATVENKIGLKRACKLALPLPFGYVNITPLKGNIEISGGLWFGYFDEQGLRGMLVRCLNPIFKNDLAKVKFSECARPFNLPYGVPVFKQKDTRTIVIGGGSKAGCVHAPLLANKVLQAIK